MAQEPSAPWSRWDQPGSQFVPFNNAPLRQQYDAPTPNSVASGLQMMLQPQNYADAVLLNFTESADPFYYDCFYGVPNNPQRLVDRCPKDIGCCATTCCPNTAWQDKYGWAVALIIVFCALVVIAVVVWFLVWLFNRAQDKRQRRYFESSQGISPAPSQVSVAPPGHFNDGGPKGYHY